MDNNSWRAAQGPMAQGQGGAGEASAMPNAANAVAATTMDNVDWRTQLQADSRERIINKIMDTLKRHLPFSGQEGLQELKKIAVRFEENIYTAATSQSDYLRKISLKMLTMEAKSQNPMANSNTSKNPPDPVLNSQRGMINAIHPASELDGGQSNAVNSLQLAAMSYLKQQQLIGQRPNVTNIQQNQLIGQPNSIPDLQQQQRLMGQQNNISNLQQQQLMGQQNNLSNMNQPQLGPQSASDLQQWQMLGSQSGESGIPANQHSAHMLQQMVALQQQMWHMNLLPNQVQQSQEQLTQQHTMSQFQSQNGQLQHLQQQSNPMQGDMQ